LRRRVFTANTVELMRGSASQGLSAVEIADTIGSTAASVRVKCCRLKIKLSRRGRSGLRSASDLLTKEPKLTVFMRPLDYAALSLKANNRRKSAVEYAAMLLKAVIDSNLYEAVLDERE
jgi:hypothetical protein